MGLATAGRLPRSEQRHVLPPACRARPGTGRARGQGEGDLPAVPRDRAVPPPRADRLRAVRHLGRSRRDRAASRLRPPQEPPGQLTRPDTVPTTRDPDSNTGSLWSAPRISTTVTGPAAASATALLWAGGTIESADP